MVTTAWFSVGRLDMTVLPLERASLVLEAVPSAADVERIRRFTAAHPNAQWTEAEQFVIDVSPYAPFLYASIIERRTYPRISVNSFM